MNISGSTTMLGLIGSPVGHSKSPEMYNYCFKKYNCDCAYLAFDVSEKEVGKAIDAIRTFQMRGANVTMPLKNAVIPYLDKLTPAAEITKSVNTIVNDGGILTGHCTDGMGFTGNLASGGVGVKDKKITIMGGGVAMKKENVDTMRESGTIVCLIASSDVIYERVKDSRERPILNGNMNIGYIQKTYIEVHKMEFRTMFSPVKIGTVQIPNRFAVPPMGNNLANTDGTLSERSKAYYGARAKGGFGLITIGSTVVYSEAKDGPRKLCLFSDDTVDGFKMVADECHKYGAKVSIQLQHAGPEGNSQLTGFPLKAASPIPASFGREIPEAISNEEVYRLIECYGDAAARAQRAGIDMVEVHCAHGYLVSTFISARTNNRLDEFGGCFENRMRLPRLIIENIRKKTGGTMPILCRINGSDEVDGGQSVQDAAAVAVYLEEVCGVDAIHVTRAVHLHDECMWAPGVVHGGFNAPFFTEIKNAVSVPVIAVGRFTEPQYAELVVRQGRADIIAFGRQSIADPELPKKAKEGRLEELTPCIGCLLGCVPNMFKGNPITCLVNPAVGREAEITPAEEKKKVAVIGGGPGGLYAAQLCALRGHDVTLFEKEGELGGNFRIAAYPPGKGDITGAIRNMIVKCEQNGVKIQTNIEVTEEILREFQPDAAVIATGSTPLILPIKGLSECGYITARDMLDGKAQTGKKVLVVGGGMVGCEAAEFLAERGHEVAIIEMKDVIGADVVPENRPFLFANFEKHHVELAVGAKVSEFFEDGVSYELADGTSGELRGFDNMILAMGSKSYNPLKEKISGIVPQVIVIGEAKKASGNACIATGEAFDAAMSI